MNTTWQNILWRQFGAAIDALENAITNCPDDLWFDKSTRYEYWYMVSHTLFWLDMYLTESPDDFTPPEPFGLEELDPAGVIPDPPYTKEQLLAYVGHCREKCREVIRNLTEEKASWPYRFGNVDLSFGDILLYNMRHVCHHTGQLNMLLRQMKDIGSRWVFKAREELGGS